MMTNAIPISLLVPWIVALHTAPDSVNGPKTAMWAFEIVVASSRPQLTWPMRESGTHRVQHTCGDSFVCVGGVLQVDFALAAGCDEGVVPLALSVFCCWVYSPSSPLFFFSDPSTSVFGSL
jgi:hypothetical protein